MGVRTLIIGCSFEREHRYCAGDCPHRPVCKTSIAYKRAALLGLSAAYRSRLCLRTRWASRLQDWTYHDSPDCRDIIAVIRLIEQELHKLESQIAIVRRQLEETEAAWR